MISLTSLVYTVVYLIVGGLIFYLLHWLIGYVGVPDPWNKVARVVLAIFAVLFIILILLSLVSVRPIVIP